ncbi:MAG: hypothetical protein KA173_07425 [Rhodoferax sp.]|nr:hypothetical protein [Rhodoferax sp.]
MQVVLKISQKISSCLLAVLSFSATATDTFTLNGRAVQLEPSKTNVQQSKSASARQADARVVVRDVASGQTSVYADGLIVTLKRVVDLNAVLQDHPALKLIYAPGVHAFVGVPRSALAATVDALGADPRVAAVHLRPVPKQIKLR